MSQENTPQNSEAYELAQLNIATIKYPTESEEMKEFMDALDGINLLAECSPGFVWRCGGCRRDINQQWKKQPNAYCI